MVWDLRSKFCPAMSCFKRNKCCKLWKRLQKSYFSEVNTLLLRKCKKRNPWLWLGICHKTEGKLLLLPQPSLSWESMSIHSQQLSDGCDPSEDQHSGQSHGPMRSSEDGGNSPCFSVSQVTEGLIAPRRREAKAIFSMNIKTLVQLLRNPSARMGGTSKMQPQHPRLWATLLGLRQTWNSRAKPWYLLASHLMYTVPGEVINHFGTLAGNSSPQ